MRYESSEGSRVPSKDRRSPTPEASRATRASREPVIETDALIQYAETIIGEVSIAAHLLNRSQAFGVDAQRYRDETMKDLYAFQRQLDTYTDRITKILANKQPRPSVRERERLQYLQERITAAQGRIAITLEPLIREVFSASEPPPTLPKDTDTPPSYWAAHRQDLITQRNHLPPQQYTSTPPHGYIPSKINGLENQAFTQTKQSNTIDSPWAHPEPVQPSFFKKSTAAVSRWLKSWF